MNAIPTPVLAIHAGAGDRLQALQENEAEITEALRHALAQGAAALEQGGDAVDAVTAAVIVLESFELFNAGRGSTLCEDGSVEMSAALMRADQAAGAVAGLRSTEHAILAAAEVLRSPQVLITGPKADAFAATKGLAQQPQSYFITDRQLKRLHEHTAAPVADHATVGAVCLDRQGGLAAGTSTGGIRAQPPGRVGDSPIIGAGTWADERVAISCTGDGEAFIRAGAARYLAALAEHGVALHHAADRALEQVARLGGRGGLIAVEKNGTVALPFTTAAMPRGVWRAGEPPAVYAGGP